MAGLIPKYIRTIYNFCITTMRKILVLLLSILLAACNPPVRSQPAISNPVPETPTTGTGSTDCGWEWATQPLSYLSTQVKTALEKSGLTGVTVAAEAYGENCLTSAGMVDHFATMETDFRITIQVASLKDREELGTLLEKVLDIIDSFPLGVVPGPNSGYIGLDFQAAAEELRLWFKVVDGEKARSLGLHGAVLLDQIENP
jgi:hypothetical protein